MNKARKAYSVFFNGKKMKIRDYILCESFISQARGLMFRRQNFNTPLVFRWKKPVKISIHSFFVGSDFLAIWLKNGKIVGKKVVKPWRFAVTPQEKFDTLIEIPLKNV